MSGDAWVFAGGALVALLAAAASIYNVTVSSRNARLAKESEENKVKVELNKSELDYTKGQVHLLIDHYKSLADEFNLQFREEYALRRDLEKQLAAALRKIDKLEEQLAELSIKSQEVFELREQLRQAEAQVKDLLEEIERLNSDNGI